MYIRKLEKRDLEAIAELERNTYPEELCMGYEDFKNDFDSHRENDLFCYGVIENKELKAYIFAYKKEIKDPLFLSFYISDFVCKNPKYLIPFMAFLKNKWLKKYNFTEKREIFAELRESSYKMLTHIKKLVPSFSLKIKKIEEVENYFSNKEKCYSICFVICPDCKPDIKSIKMLKIKKSLSKRNRKISNIFNLYESCFCGINKHNKFLNIQDIIPFLYEKGFGPKTIKKHKNFILSFANQWNVDKMKSCFSGQYKVFYEFELSRENGDKVLAMEKKLIDYGYVLTKSIRNNDFKDYPKQYSIRKYDESIYLAWTKYYEAPKGYEFRDCFSSFSRYIKRAIAYHEKQDFFNYLTFIDNSGKENFCCDVTIMNFSNVYDNILNREIFKRKIDLMLKIDDSSDYIVSSTSRVLYEIKVNYGEDFALDLAYKIKKETEEDSFNRIQIIHDYKEAFQNLLAYKQFYTRTAGKILLSSSINKIIQIKDNLSAVAAMGILVDVKLFRKEFSDCIKKNEDFKEFFLIKTNSLEKEILDSLKIPKNEVPAVVNYVEVMKRYKSGFNVLSLFNTYNFKKSISLQMIRGDYPGYFKESENLYADRYVSNYFHQLLQKKKQKKQTLI